MVFRIQINEGLGVMSYQLIQGFDEIDMCLGLGYNQLLLGLRSPRSLIKVTVIPRHKFCTSKLTG